MWSSAASSIVHNEPAPITTLPIRTQDNLVLLERPLLQGSQGASQSLRGKIKAEARTIPNRPI